MFRLIFFIVALTLVFAKDWAHFYAQTEVRHAVRAENGALWGAFTWGLQERIGKTENNYVSGSNNLKASDFVHIFALPGGDIIAASKNGTLSRKNINSKNFETINTSFVEKKRNILQGVGKRFGNILILPFEGSISFFDYSQNVSLITLYKIGTTSLESFAIKKIVIDKDSVIWLDLGEAIWKRKIDWENFRANYDLLDDKLWEKAYEMPNIKEETINYPLSNTNFYFNKVRNISVLSGKSTIAWGGDRNLASILQNESNWGMHFAINETDSEDGQNIYPAKSIASMPNGSFAVGLWGAGVLTFDASFPKPNRTGWFHATNQNEECPSAYRAGESSWTIVQGLAVVPDYSGYIFSYASDANYGIGFVDNNGVAKCFKDENNSSIAAASVSVRKNEEEDWEIYVAWKSSLASKTGGVDLYKMPANAQDFSPKLEKKWAFDFGSPIDMAFDSEGILWAVSNSNIFYLNKEENQWMEPSYIRGFNGGIISSLESDAQNGLWVSTLGDGAYSFSQKNNSPDTLTAKQYKIKDGFINETIYDIGIDTIKGKVFFGHDLGLSIYSTPFVRNAEDFMKGNSPETIAYPNPFRPDMHSGLRIDYISEKSSVHILDSSGKRVRFFKGDEVKGGTVFWDGKNKSGTLVAPGLYYYIAADGKKTVKGKILVER